ncbi:MAG: hypothetical protein HDT05_00065 [Bacteroidales bacterium]|nr:hypothetical protein [Bacteroidales bacterium]
MSKKIKLTYLIGMSAMMLICGGCFTGIESTKKIGLSREERKTLAPTAEELYLSEISSMPDSVWARGKRFIVAGDRGSVLFEPRKIVSGNYSLSTGDTLLYIDTHRVTLPDGSRKSSLRFSRGEDEFSYVPYSKNDGQVVRSDEIPGLVDPDMLEEVASKMLGNTYWILTSVWEDSDGNKVEGRRFDKVEVTGIEAGNMIFPVKVDFRDSKGERRSVLMNIGQTGTDSRSFAYLFRLSDPRADHSSISEVNWKNIMNGKVAIGMTKDECRLARGNPSDVNTGHDYQHSLLIWNYPDGTMLYFVDGILRGINAIPN